MMFLNSYAILKRYDKYFRSHAFMFIPSLHLCQYHFGPIRNENITRVL